MFIYYFLDFAYLITGVGPLGLGGAAAVVFGGAGFGANDVRVGAVVGLVAAGAGFGFGAAVAVFVAVEAVTAGLGAAFAVAVVPVVIEAGLLMGSLLTSPFVSGFFSNVGVF